MKGFLDQRPIVIALAGPNGAGKSTFYQAYLRNSGLPFVNADEIARSLPIDAYRAAELAGQLRKQRVDAGESFIFETVLSDPVGEKVDFLKQVAASGYTVGMIFIGIDSMEASDERVSMRVLQGGHDVPLEKLQGRYPRTMKNLRYALQVLPFIFVYDNSDLLHPYHLVARRLAGKLELFVPAPDWLQPLLPCR
jgi:predicted ABC-type ATPase